MDSNVGIPHFLAIVGQINVRTVIERLRWRNESELNPVIRVTLSLDLDIIGRVMIALARRIAPARRQQEAQYWGKEVAGAIAPPGSLISSADRDADAPGDSNSARTKELPEDLIVP